MKTKLEEVKDELVIILEDFKIYIEKDSVEEFEKNNHNKIEIIRKKLSEGTNKLSAKFLISDSKIEQIKKDKKKLATKIEILENELQILSNKKTSNFDDSPLSDDFKRNISEFLSLNKVNEVFALAKSWCSIETAKKLNLPQEFVNSIESLYNHNITINNKELSELFTQYKLLFIKAYDLYKYTNNDLVSLDSYLRSLDKKSFTKDQSLFFKEYDFTIKRISKYLSNFTYNILNSDQLSEEYRNFIESIFIFNSSKIKYLRDFFNTKYKLLVSKCHTIDEKILFKHILNFKNKYSEDDKNIDIRKIQGNLNKLRAENKAIEEELAKLTLKPQNIDQVNTKGSNNSLNKIDFLLQIISKEVEFLKEINITEDLKAAEAKFNNKIVLDFAQKMTIGFIGHYLKELKSIKEVQNYIYSDDLFSFSINKAVFARNKTMHDLNASSFNLTETIDSHLLPWQKNYEALLILIGSNKKTIGLSNNLLRDFLDKIPEENSKESLSEILNEMNMLYANIRLQRLDTAIKIYKNKLIQDFLEDDKSSLVLKFHIYYLYISAINYSGNVNEVLSVIEESFKCFASFNNDDKSSYYYIYEALFSVKLTTNKSPVPKDFGEHIINPTIKLCIADNLIENFRLDEAYKILIHVKKEYENGNNFEIMYHCYKILSMYYRCTRDMPNAIYYLDKSLSLLKEHENEYILSYGSKIQMEYFIINRIKTSCLYYEGSILFHEGSIDKAKTCVLESIKETILLLKENKILNANPLDKASLHITLCGSYSVLAKILNKNHQILIENNYKIARDILNSLEDSNSDMSICEAWIGLADILLTSSNQKEFYYCLAKAEKNVFWEQCAQQNDIPLKYSIKIALSKASIDDPVDADLTYTQFYDLLSNESITLAGET